MKAQASRMAPIFLLFLMVSASAATFYVDVNCPSPVAPYTNWPTAATNIQDAIDAASEGALVLVTNGVYQAGGRVVAGVSHTNRVVVSKPVTVQSVNGPSWTVIRADEPTAQRCVYLTNGAVLSGFTLTNGYVRRNGDGALAGSGGAVFCGTTNALVTNCIISGNYCAYYGGGAYGCLLKNCVLTNNVAFSGGGAFQSILENCLVVSNVVRKTEFDATSHGGGAFECFLTNCTVVGNASYPVFAAGTFNCVLVNCILYYNGAQNYLQFQGTNIYCCTAPVAGWGGITNEPLFANPDGGDFHLQTNSQCIDRGNNAFVAGSTDLDGRLRILGSAVDMGAYESRTPPTVYYVDVNNPTPVLPYTNWLTAATNIQDAVDVATNGDIVLVTNGVYQTGWLSLGGISNRVALTKPLTLRSVNGPAVTIIQADADVKRCVHMTNNAVLSGFTLSGVTNLYSYAYDGGGGVRCPSTNALVTNCVITGGSGGAGGGAYRGTLKNCVLTNNLALYGGGAYESFLENCLIVSNRARSWYHPAPYGGGAYNSTLINCTVVGNCAGCGGVGYSGGTDGGTLINCIVYYNWGLIDNNIGSSYYGNSSALNCCTTPSNAPTIITNEPLFVNMSAGDFRLQSNSPCINSGVNGYGTGVTDLDNNPRIVAGTVDIGAYEFQSPASLLSYAWAQRNGLPTDGTADFTDNDSDGMNNWQEWRADTSPTNALSVLRMVPTTNGPLTYVTWQSISTRTYWLERSTNLGSVPMFQTIATNITGVPGWKTYNDATATNAGPYFYRVGVQ